MHVSVYCHLLSIQFHIHFKYYILQPPTTPSELTTTHISDSSLTTKEGLITVATAPSLFITNLVREGCSQSREAVAWAFSLFVTLLLTGLLSVNIIVLIYKHRQTEDNTAQAPVYEMDNNPCYESSTTNNTFETNTYESPIDTGREYV